MVGSGKRVWIISFPELSISVLVHHTPGLPTILPTFLDTVQNPVQVSSVVEGVSMWPTFLDTVQSPVQVSSVVEGVVSMWLLIFCPVQGTTAAAAFPELWSP